MVALGGRKSPLGARQFVLVCGPFLLPATGPMHLSRPGMRTKGLSCFSRMGAVTSSGDARRGVLISMVFFFFEIRLSCGLARS